MTRTRISPEMERLILKDAAEWLGTHKKGAVVRALQKQYNLSTRQARQYIARVEGKQ